MKAIFSIIDTNIEFEFENFSVIQSRITCTEPNEFNIRQKKPVGDIITFISSNMPPPLQEEIEKTIERYCNQ